MNGLACPVGPVYEPPDDVGGGCHGTDPGSGPVEGDPGASYALVAGH